MLLFFFPENNAVTVLFKKFLVTVVEIYRFLLQTKVDGNIKYYKKNYTQV